VPAREEDSKLLWMRSPTKSGRRRRLTSSTHPRLVGL
jgi:hypothetical protein